MCTCSIYAIIFIFNSPPFFRGAKDSLTREFDENQEYHDEYERQYSIEGLDEEPECELNVLFFCCIHLTLSPGFPTFFNVSVYALVDLLLVLLPRNLCACSHT